MLDQYRPILFACSLIVALWAVAITSNPSFPEPLHLSMLIAGAAWLVFGGIISNKERRFVAAIFLLATAIAPFIFYSELYYIQQNNQDIDPTVFEANFKHAVVIYNMLRYFLLGCSFLVIMLRLGRAIKNFAQDRPE